MSAATTMPDNLPSMAKLNLDSNVVEKSSLHSTQPSSGYVTPKSESLRSTSAATTTAAPTSGPVKTPFSHPLSSSTPVIRPALTTEQASKYDSILESVKAWQTIPTTTARNGPEEPITSEERMWLTRECLLRYLRATSWSVPDALKRLQYTMAWKREYEVSTFTADYISPENETGKQVILGYDANARPCLYMNPGKQNTKKSEKQIHHTVYMLERAIDMMDAGQETTALLINFKNSTSGSSPSVGQGKQVLNILQSHYPERLGRALISDRKYCPLWYTSVPDVCSHPSQFLGTSPPFSSSSVLSSIPSQRRRWSSIKT